jgi:dTDP-4-dehydrorhamnose 3,5-epimerase/CDP-3, 6-dideoxy-D-glycero-D-glycero-4-hexulose-5-epimerase
MQIKETNIKDVKLIDQFRHDDARGSFVKTFHKKDFETAGLDFDLRESFYSVSHKNILRGMHFHTAPYTHDKIVFCTHGAIIDVALDIRPNSPTVGQFVTAELSFDNNNALFIPAGFAHGFLTKSDDATTYYLVSGEYNALHDAGIKYDSFGMNWGSTEIITNERDSNFLTLNEFLNG